MTQIIQPDVGEACDSSHFFPYPIQPDSAASSSRKHKLAALEFDGALLHEKQEF